MSNQDYYQKYIKYKHKYIDLKNNMIQEGGRQKKQSRKKNCSNFSNQKRV